MIRPDFELVEHAGVTLLVYRPWWNAGVVHGMTTRQLAFSGSSFESDVVTLQEAIGVANLALPRQCHGAEVVDVRMAERHADILQSDGDLVRRVTGDAILAPARQVTTSVTAYGVMTADCVPVIVRGENGYALIHAGWRGLANGVIAAAVAALGAPVEALIFACAGAERYQVGREVLEAIGSTAVHAQPDPTEDRYLLDTVETSIRQLRAIAPQLAVHAARVCTLSDSRFHSHRRDGDGAGRCVSFVVPPL
jgi:copper oxidase (laccase) domain-containing protein